MMTGTNRGRRRLVGAGLCASLMPGLGDTANVQPAAGPFDPDAWLSRAQAAAVSLSYQGTFTFSGGGMVSSSKVAHFRDARHRYERIEVLDGQPRRQFRLDDEVLTLWLQSKVAVVESDDVVPEFPALPSGSQRWQESYDVRWVGQDRVAGQEADVVVAKPRDGQRFAQRLWAERSTGLLLRADLLGAKGDLLESSAFTEVMLGVRIAAETVTGPMRRLEGYKVLRSLSRKVVLESEGWSMVRTPAGFQRVSCMRKNLHDPVGGGDPREVLQAVFSDGLTHVSVFVEAFDAGRHKPMRTNLGATHTSMSRQGDAWLTIVGDVPMTTIAQFESGFQRR